MESTSNIEFTDSFCEDINRVFLDRVYIVIEEKVQISDVYLTIHKSTKLGVLTFMIPAISVDSIKVLHNMSLNSIKIREQISDSEDSIKTWLSDNSYWGIKRAVSYTEELIDINADNIIVNILKM